ncbi:hypothetical protein E2C01_046184 [Portunus trituberculatus]|uniref:Uncharacterized protein n=1 Tax=Portunus trituberculatus TaxID=210409 RepID=A0A5B7FX65_PORTR|nr:hypothetical protein [Portunus trituberculatus]
MGKTTTITYLKEDASALVGGGKGKYSSRSLAGAILDAAMLLRRVFLAAGLFLVVFVVPDAEGLALSLVVSKMKLIHYIVRSFTVTPLDPGPNAFCKCVGLLDKCDYFLIHKTDHVHCNFMKRYCCSTEAVEQMLHKRVSGVSYVPPKAMAFKPYDNYVHLPQIKTQAATTARTQCGCQLAFWSCEVVISKPWKVFDKSFLCSFMHVFCCQESFLKDVVVPTVKLHAAITNTTRGREESEEHGAEPAGLDENR